MISNVLIGIVEIITFIIIDNKIQLDKKKIIMSNDCDYNIKL